MIVAKIQVNGAIAKTVYRKVIPAGIIGAQVEFDYAEDIWHGLRKTVVFKGAVTKDVVTDANIVTIPHEVVEKPFFSLSIGVYGVDADGNIAIPTLWESIGAILDAAAPSGDTNTDPSLPVWAQIQAMIGNLDELETTARDNLVAAVNEVAQSGGGGGSASIAMRVDGGFIQYSTDNGKKWVNLIAEADLKGDKGDKGDTGDTGPQGIQGVQGPQGAKGDPGTPGKDGITPHIGDNGNWYLGATDTGKPSRGAAGSAGQAGKDGKSAYQYAQEGGYTGTEAEFTAKLAAEKFANPNALTFTGAVTGSYDGSEALTVEIPSGGGSTDAWETILDTVIEQDTGNVSFSVDASGNPFSLKEFTVFVVQPPIVGQTTNNRIEFSPNNGLWGKAGNIKLKSSPKETEETVYGFIHANTVDGRMNLLAAVTSSNYSTVRHVLSESTGRNDYNGSFCLKVNTNTDEIRYCEMPLTKIGFYGITSTIFGAGTRILLRGIRS